MSEQVPAFNLEVVERPDGTFLRLAGDLDMSSAAELVRVAERLVDSGVTVDMSAVDFCDSAGLNALVDLRKAGKRTGGRFAITGVRDDVRFVFEVNGLVGFLGIEPPPTVAPSKVEPAP